jgi:hypothetical protein
VEPTPNPSQEGNLEPTPNPSQEGNLEPTPNPSQEGKFWRIPTQPEERPSNPLLGGAGVGSSSPYYKSGLLLRQGSAIKRHPNPGRNPHQSYECVISDLGSEK